MRNVFDIAAKRAVLTPDKLAFTEIDSGRNCTYAEFDTGAGKAASVLRRRGVGPGDRVAILSLNDIAFFEILIGCARAEAILVPLNWRQPVPELLPVLRDCRPRLLLADAENEAVARTLAGELGIPFLARGDFLAEQQSAVADAFETAWPCDRIWYLLYTSGTTGTPKAVIQTPGMVFANYVNIGQAIDLVSSDTTLNFLPLFHTAGINLYTLPMLIAGGTVHILRKFEVGQVVDALVAGQCSAFFGVPAIYQALSLHPQFDKLDLSQVRSWACGGAPLPVSLIRQFAARGIKVCNGMGMTETGPTVFLVDPGHAETKIGSVGKPQILSEVRVVDAAQRDLGPEQAGELLIRGPNVTPGYWNNDAATRAAFLDGGWLKTGDVAKRDADGFYFIVDRIKDMYISGGENVYPAEVERVLYAHPAVLEAAVVGIADEKWGEVGAAFILPRPGMTIDRTTISAFCRERLAAYKVPKHIEIVADFPRTAAGKIQKHLLRTRRG
ncbi:MAG: long-chain fatty acid--CoA ligase [Rhodospirillaceae bacterium]|nr:long-chain fatty acid--CoA ligase [Rhodospirillaceae bacterium]